MPVKTSSFQMTEQEFFSVSSIEILNKLKKPSNTLTIPCQYLKLKYLNMNVYKTEVVIYTMS